MVPPATDIARPAHDRLIGAVRSTWKKASDIGSLTSAAWGGEREFRYRAFISYSHADSKIARWLRRSIETYAIPRALIGIETERGRIPRRLSPVFRDEDELPGASELGPELEGALRASAALIVICSPAAAISPWVDREIRFFKQVNPGRPVLGVIAAGVPGGKDECFPAALRMSLDDDGILSADTFIEPLAPDLQKQDRQMVRLKIISGLLGVKYNDLYRRDRRRARWLAAGFGSLGFLIIAALTALSIAAFTYARMAVHQRDLAQRAQLLAEHNADMAERRAWLAQVAATEVRRDAAIIGSRRSCR